MKSLSILSLFTLHSALFTLSASAAVPEDWVVDLAAQPPQVFTLQRPRGETYELEAVLKRHGKPFEPAITNACIYWQTNGMENLYWSAPASVSNNVLRATWLPSMDPGAATVRGYIGDPGHIYAAAFQFRFIASPGATPNELPLPQKVIDFAKVTVLNPPWSGGGGGVDTNAVIDIANATIATNPVVAAKIDGPTFAPTNTADASGKAADAKLTGVALTNRYTKAETDAKLSPIAAQLAALQSGKRGVKDLTVYDDESVFECYSAESIDGPIQKDRCSYYWDNDEGRWHIVVKDADGRVVDDRIPYDNQTDRKAYRIEIDFVTGNYNVVFIRVGYRPIPTSDTLAKESQLSQKRDKADGDFTGTTIFFGINTVKGVEISGSNGPGRIRVGWETGETSIDIDSSDSIEPKVTIGKSGFATGTLSVESSNGESASIKKDGNEVRVEEDNTCHKTEYGGEWTFGGAGYDPDNHTYSLTYNGYYAWTLKRDGADYAEVYDDENVASLDFAMVEITATRSAVCTKDKLFVTEDVVDGKVSAAVSTNNPAFVSAVRAVSPSTIRTYDSVRQCWWVLEMVNGVPTWTVED